MQADPPLHDSLTGLPGRGLFLHRLHRAVQRSFRSGEPVAVLFTDLDSFKSINETYGHRVADELLRAVAERLERQGAFVPTDTEIEVHHGRSRPVGRRR